MSEYIVMTTLGTLGILPLVAPFVYLFLLDEVTAKHWCLAITAAIPVAVLQTIALIYISRPSVSASIAIVLTLMFFGCILYMVYEENKAHMNGWSVFNHIFTYLYGGMSLILILFNVYAILSYY